MLSALKSGHLSFRRQGEVHAAQTGEGFIEVGSARVIILVEHFERGEIYALRALLEWQTTTQPEQLRNAIARADTKIRDLEIKGQDKGEEYQTLSLLLTAARARLDKQ